MAREKFSREFKIEAVRLVTERGVAEAARDLDVAESALRRWMREVTAKPATAFPGNGQMRADIAEIAVQKKEVARLRVVRDIHKEGETIDRHWFKDNGRTLFSRARRHELRLHRQTPPHLACKLAM